MFPATTEIPFEIVNVSVCEKCTGRFVYRPVFGPYPWDHGANQKVWNREWCPGCNADILHDIEEERLGGKRMLFMGFKFQVATGSDGLGQIVLWKRLVHPESPTLIYSFHNYSLLKQPYEPFGLYWACAWLIAHWWEHALDICPCQGGVKDDAKGSNFRNHVLKSILWYHNQLR